MEDRSLARRLLAILLDQWQQKLQDWSLNDLISTAAQESLLLDGLPSRLNVLQGQWAQGDFSALPPIILLPTQSMHGALGAYAASTGIIYLNEDWLPSARPDAVHAVLTEELGHFLDDKLNPTDTSGDEGAYFAAWLALGSGISPIEKANLRAENDRGTVFLATGQLGNHHLESGSIPALKGAGSGVGSSALESLPRLAPFNSGEGVEMHGFLAGGGEKVNVEMASPLIADQVLWSRGFGRRIQGNWNLGEQLGLPNEARYKAFFGVATDAEKAKYNDFFGGTFNGFNSFIGFDTGSIGGKALSLYASGSLGIGGSKGRNSNATFKAGLELDTGYNLGGVRWDLPLTADLTLATKANSLSLNLNSDISSSYIQYTLPYLYLYLKGILETDAAVYLDAELGAKGDTWLYSFDESIGVHEKIDLSTKFNHEFIRLDSRNPEQVVDWITGKKIFKTGSLTGASTSETIKLGSLFNLGLSLPDLNGLNFTRLLNQSDISRLLSIPSLTRVGEGLEVDMKDNLIYSFKDKIPLIDFSFDLDSFISQYLPIPISFKDDASFRLLGNKFSYDATFSIVDLEPTLQFNLGYQIDLGFSKLKPRIQVENGSTGYTSFDYAALFSGIDLSTDQGRSLAVQRLNGLDLNGNSNQALDLRAVFDPEVFINARLFVEPILTLRTGIGEYKLAIDTPFFSKTFGGENKYIIDTPDVDIFRGKEFTFLNKSYAKKLSSLLDLSSLVSIPLTIPINPIAEVLGIELFNGTDGPDFFAGSEKNNIANLFGGADVAMLSPGIDRINAGVQPNNSFGVTYYDLFATPFKLYAPNSGDVFVIDSDIFLAPFSRLRLQAGFDDINTPIFALGSDTDYTILDNIERLVLSDELQASTQGITLDLRAMAWDKRTINIGGFLSRSDYSEKAPLPVGILTGTAGNDILLVPIGHNRTSGYFLGDGNDFVRLGAPLSNGGEFVPGYGVGNYQGSMYWSNPYSNYAFENASSPDSLITSKIIVEDPGYIWYSDDIDLGSGSNTVDFSPAFGDLQSLYSPLIVSVNPGEVNSVTGSLDGILRIQNLLGSFDLSELTLTGAIYGIFSAGGNNLDLSGGTLNRGNSEITLLVDAQGLRQKLGVDELNELTINITDWEITYASGQSQVKDQLKVFSNDLYSYVILARADQVANEAYQGISSFNDQNQINTLSRLKLDSPLRQTITVDQKAAPSRILQIHGRRPDQYDAFTKVVIKNTGERVDLGLTEDEVFDEVIFEDISNPELAFVTNGRVGNFRFNSKSGGIQAAVGPEFDPKTELSYNYNIFATDKNDRWILDYDYANLSFDLATAPTLTIQSISPLTLGGLPDYRAPRSAAILTRPAGTEDWYAPFQTYHLGDGDDHFVSNSQLYEWIYPGLGNNIIVSPELGRQLILVDPLSGTPRTVDSSSGLRQGDIVVYTDGSSQDYVISREGNAVRVVKPDGSIDLLFGIALIKFETDDVKSLVLPSWRSGDQSILRDIFGNDVRNRLFYSSTLDEAGLIHYHTLSDQDARDRVNLDGDIVYQPGRAQALNEQVIAAGSRELILSRLDLVRGFRDADIDIKKLYSIDSLRTENMRINQSGALATQLDNGDWQFNLTVPIDVAEPTLEISYDIIEPEGYRHFARMRLGLDRQRISEDLLARTAQVETNLGPSTAEVNVATLGQISETVSLSSQARDFLERYVVASPAGSTPLKLSDSNAVFMDLGIESNGMSTLMVNLDIATEVQANTFIGINALSGQAFDASYSKLTGEGVELIDSNKNGLVDRLRFALKDGSLLDSDGLRDNHVRVLGAIALMPSQPVTEPLYLSSETAQLLYVAYYGRPGDVGGLGFWKGKIQEGGFSYGPRAGDGLTDAERPVYQRIVDDFGQGPEYEQLFAGKDNTQKVDAIYRYCFGRNSEVDPVTGENYWVGKIDRNEITLAQMAVEVALGAQQGDLVFLNNRIQSASTFFQQLDTPQEQAAYAGAAAGTLALNWLQTFGPTAATTAQADDLIAQLVATASLV